jgi:N-acetylmuramic acid 6-phosphate etherase
MADQPSTELASARFDALDAWDDPAVLDALWEGQLAAVASVRLALPALAAAAAEAAPLLQAGGRLVYAGAGTSGRIAVQDGAELAPTFDWPADRLVLMMAGGEAALVHSVENAEDRADLAVALVERENIGKLDVVIGLAASGTTPWTLACLTAARGRGALTIGVANNPDTSVLEAAAHRILLPTPPEPVAGSTRMGAGTAQKVVLNLFSTLLMIRLGRVYRGRMVDMQARNEKLRRRAERMVRELTGASPELVHAALEQAGGHVKTAVLVVSGHSPEQARVLLERHRGRLRDALGRN